MRPSWESEIWREMDPLPPPPNPNFIFMIKTWLIVSLQVVFIHPGSTVFKQRPTPNYVACHELKETKKKYMMMLTAVEINWKYYFSPRTSYIPLQYPEVKKPQKQPQQAISLDPPSYIEAVRCSRQSYAYIAAAPEPLRYKPSAPYLQKFEPFIPEQPSFNPFSHEPLSSERSVTEPQSFKPSAREPPKSGCTIL